MLRDWLRSDENWKRPSSWLLIAVVAANMLVPVGYWVFGDARTGDPSPTETEGMVRTNAQPDAQQDTAASKAREYQRPGARSGESDRSTATARSGAADPAVRAVEVDDADAADAADAADPRPGDASSPPAAAVALPVEPVRPPDIARRTAPPERVCRVWGPFPDEAQARLLAATLELDDFEVRQAADAAPTEFLVRARVEGGADAGERAMERLASEGLDSYLLSQGADGAVLAVGVFSNQARAETQRERMDELGYTGSVHPLSRSGASYHLLARVPPDFEPEQPFLGLCSDIAPGR